MEQSELKSTVVAALQHRDSQLEAELKSKFARTDQSVDELSSRTMALEQLLASRSGGGVIGSEQKMGHIAGLLASQASTDSAFLHLKQGNQGSARAHIPGDLKSTLVNDGNGDVGANDFPTNPMYRGRFLEAQRPLMLIEALPMLPVSSDTVEYVQITSTVDAAEQDLEGDEKQEVDLEGAMKTANIATIAAWSTASRQVLDDNLALEAEIQVVLAYKCRKRLEDQVINGTGGTGKIDGLLNQSTAFTAAIGTTAADMIGESMVAQSVEGFKPSVVVMNPMDWYRLTIEKTADDEYLFGSPMMPLPPALWSARVVSTPALAAGTALTIDPQFTTLLDRMSPTVMVSTQHKDYFTRNLLAILGELRAGLEVRDIKAVNVVTLPS